MRRPLVDMRAHFGSFLLLSCLAFGTACGSTEERPAAGVAPKPVYTRVGRTDGGPMVVTRDESIAVATNRSGGVVTVFRLDPKKPPTGLVTGKTEIDIDDALADRRTPAKGSEPWAAVVGKDDDTAYVIARQAGRVVRIVNLHDRPKVDGWVTVGSEPTSIVISPDGVRLFVANWGDGTISVVTTEDHKLGSPFAAGTPLDLNPTLAETGFLGSVEPRQGLAHPRALAMTDDGDDDPNDETLYATEFFSQPIPGAVLPSPPAPPPDGGAPPPPDTSVFDRNRQGVVYRIPIAEKGAVYPITLAPVEETGFLDSDEKPTGCFPNQLYAAGVNAGRLYVTSLCASPRGPLGAIKKGDPPINDTSNFKTVMHPVLFAIDITTNKEVPGQRRVLTREIEDLNALSSGAVPRMPLIPLDLVFARTGADGSREAFVTAMGADAVFRIGDPASVAFVDIAPTDQRVGHLPIGTAVLEKARLALVLNDQSQNLSVVDLKSNKVVKVERSIDDTDPAKVEANAGHFRFATGTEEWSLNGQAWSSCEGCHPDGLSDGVTWFFSRGPRRTISTAGTYDEQGTRRVLLWTGNVDEVHDVEVIVRTVSGGVGAVLWTYGSTTPVAGDRLLYDGATGVPGKATSTLRNGLNGSVKALLESTEPFCKADATVCDRSLTQEWNHIDAYIRSVRAPNRPTSLWDGNKDAENVNLGGELFKQGRCAACHGGPNWTISRVFYTPGEDDSGALPSTPPPQNPDGSYPEFKLGRLRKTSYFVPPDLQRLNPVSLPDGYAPFRSWNPGSTTPFEYLYGTGTNGQYDSKKTHGNDQINCVLRAVGTFPGQNETNGVVVSGAPPVLEVRADMKNRALGDNGFNVPSLVGLATAGSYFHAGNARTLEEVFDPRFGEHLGALSPYFLTNTLTRKTDVANLVAFLLSIDDVRTAEPIPSDMPFDPDLCGQPGVIRSQGTGGTGGTSGDGGPTECTPGQVRCDPARTNGSQACGPTGTWGAISPCAPRTDRCDALTGYCTACYDGSMNCDANASDCEMNLRTSLTCGTTCEDVIACNPVNSNGATCDGKCLFSCNTGYADCDGDGRNGCETFGACPP